MARIPIKIFAIPSSELISTGTIASPYQKQDYLIGVTDKDIVTDAESGNEVIYLVPENFPDPIDTTNYPAGATRRDRWNVTRRTNAADNTRAAINLGSKLYFIQDSTSKKTFFDQYPTFEFYVNPENISITSQKLLTEIRTRRGWEIQHWGEAISELSVAGRSGGMHHASRSFGEAVEKLTDSTAWKRLDQLKQFYKADYALANKPQNRQLAMTYYDKLLIGYFKSFNGPDADAMNPYIVKYSFTFKVTDERQFPASITNVATV